MSTKIEVTRKRLNVMRDTNRVYFAGMDKRDPKVAEMRKMVAEDTRYYHQKWLNAKQS
jgi:hypothetical protein